MEKIGVFTSRIVREEFVEEEHCIIRYNHHGSTKIAKATQAKEIRRRVEKELQKMEKSEQVSSMSGSRAVFTFVQPTEKLKITYREQQARLRLAVARHRDLQEGTVLDTFEKGVGYPVIHVNFNPKSKQESQLPPVINVMGPYGTRRKVVASSSAESLKEQRSTHGEQVQYKSQARRSNSTSLIPNIPRLLKEDALGPSVHVQQGLYEEVKRIEPDFAFSPRDNIDNRAFIILGFKTLDTGFSSVLEQTWRDWTGARAIYLRLHNDFDLAKIVFYHRVHPVNDLDMFMYIVLVECWNVNSKNLIHILDFVQRMRVERLNGYISLYRDLGLEEEDSNYHSASQESLNCDEDLMFRSVRSSLSPNGFSIPAEADEALEDERLEAGTLGGGGHEAEGIENTRHREMLVVETKKHHKKHQRKNHAVESERIENITVESRQIP